MECYERCCAFCSAVEHLLDVPERCLLWSANDGSFEVVFESRAALTELVEWRVLGWQKTFVAKVMTAPDALAHHPDFVSPRLAAGDQLLAINGRLLFGKDPAYNHQPEPLVALLHRLPMPLRLRFRHAGRARRGCRLWARPDGSFDVRLARAPLGVRLRVGTAAGGRGAAGPAAVVVSVNRSALTSAVRPPALEPAKYEWRCDLKHGCSPLQSTIAKGTIAPLPPDVAYEPFPHTACLVSCLLAISSALEPEYHCEACRAVLEEVEYHLERTLYERRNKGEAAEEINPRDTLEWLCKFTDKQPEAMRVRWSAYSKPYHDFCADFMADEHKRGQLIETLNGDRAVSQSGRQSGMVQRATELCSRKLQLCPEPRAITTACAACHAVALDLDTMLTRVPGDIEQLTVEENISSQCEAIPWRFPLGSKAEADLLTETCQEYIGEYDDAIVRAATKFQPPTRRAELLKTCAEYCGADDEL
eukprot:g1803.t1